MIPPDKAPTKEEAWRQLREWVGVLWALGEKPRYILLVNTETNPVEWKDGLTVDSHTAQFNSKDTLISVLAQDDGKTSWMNTPFLKGGIQMDDDGNVIENTLRINNEGHRYMRR